MSGSDWTPDSSASDVEEDASSALNTHLVQLLAEQRTPRVTSRRHAAPHASDTAGQAALTRSPPTRSEREPPVKHPRIDVAGLVRQALSQSSAACPSADLDDVVGRVAEALRRSPDAAEVSRAVTKALTDPLNAALRERVLSGRLPPSELAALDEVSLLNPDARAALEKARLERLNQHSVEYLEKLSLTKTNLYTCPACGSQECYANFRSTDFVKWQGDDETPTLLRCCKCSFSFRQ